MSIIALDKPASSGTNYFKWEAPFKASENIHLKGVEAQNRNSLCYLVSYIDLISTPDTESGGITTIVLRKFWANKITDSLHWEGDIHIYSPMKVCLVVFNAAANDELNFRIFLEKQP